MRTTFKVERLRMGQGPFFEELGGYHTTVKGLAVVGEKDSWSLLHTPSGRFFGIHAKRLEDFNLLLGELAKLDLSWDISAEEILRNKIVYTSAIKGAIVKSSLEEKFSNFMRRHS